MVKTGELKAPKLKITKSSAKEYIQALIKVWV